MSDPAIRIRLIERSLECFVLGLVSLIPLLGLGPALVATTAFMRVWAESKQEWNAAYRYALAGFCLAWAGILISLLSIGLFVLVLIKYYGF